MHGKRFPHDLRTQFGAVLIAVLLAGCAAPYTPAAVGDPLPPGAISAWDAESIARESLEDQRAPVWASVSGPIDLVYDALLPKYLERPSFANEPYANAQVWGVQFKVTVEICPPSGSECFNRDGLRTVFIDALTGKWLRTSTWAPGTDKPLPTIRPLK